MAKRNKARKQPVAANATNPSNSAADKIDSALAAVDNLTESDNGTILGAMAEKLKLAKTSHDAASKEQKKEASESYGNDIQNLVGELKKLVEQNKKTEADNKLSLSISFFSNSIFFLSSSTDSSNCFDLNKLCLLSASVFLFCSTSFFSSPTKV